MHCGQVHLRNSSGYGLIDCNYWIFTKAKISFLTFVMTSSTLNPAGGKIEISLWKYNFTLFKHKGMENYVC